MNARHEKIRQKYYQVFGDHGKYVSMVRAPGRVNLMGEHTDYNNGFVLPTNLGGLEVIVAAQTRSDNSLSLYSMDYDERMTVTLGTLKYMAGDGWANYVKAVFWALENAGHRPTGMNILISGNIPQGAGLSSSAALEAAIAAAALISEGAQMEAPRLAKALQSAENSFIGVQSGLMDPMSVLNAEKGHALFLDCRNGDTEQIPLKLEGATLLVIDSGVSRSLKTGDYNKRREECKEALKLLKLKNDKYESLRDVKVLAFERWKTSLPGALRNRAEHVIWENDRVLKAKEALLAGDMVTLGDLFNKSHNSQARLYNVSTEEIEILVGLARGHDACLGVRLTGGGFGGCLVALVKDEGVENFAETVKRGYQKRAGGKAVIYPVIDTEPTSEIVDEDDEPEGISPELGIDLG